MYVLLKSHLPTLFTLNEFPQPVNLPAVHFINQKIITSQESQQIEEGVGLSRVTVLAIHLGKIILQ